MRRYDLIAKICDSMLTLGWGPYQNDHEDANGQFEMNWTYSDALTTADRHAFFKYMVKTLAERARPARDVHAQAVPEPVGQRLPRARLAVGRRDRQEPVSRSPTASWGCREPRTSSSAALLHNAEALCALTNPTVNSFKRINGAPTLSGRHLVAEHHQLHRQQPHAHDPHPGQSIASSCACADGAANPYLLQAAVIAAGLDGIANQREPGHAPRQQHVHAPAASRARRAGCRPTCSTRCGRCARTRSSSPRWARRSSTRSRKLKEAEWAEHHAQISPWERRSMLDC